MADKDSKPAQDVAEDAKPEQAEVVFRYYGSGESYPGVPPGDILKHVYDAQPEWIQRSIAASPLYKAVGSAKKDDKKESEK